MYQTSEYRTDDPINAIFLVYISYRDKFEGKDINTWTYPMRWKNHPNYNGNATEANRVLTFLSERISPYWVANKNPLKKVILYRNLNRGRTIKGVENPKVFEIVLKKGFISEQPYIYTTGMSYQEQKLWNEMLGILTEYSKSQQKNYDAEYAKS